jgi:hypothetical protein
LLNVSNASGVTYHDQFHIGGVSVQVSSERSEDVAFGPSLAPFRAHSGRADVEIRVEWTESLRRNPSAQLFDSGSVWRLLETGDNFEFEFSSPSLGEEPYKRFLIDKTFRSATLLMNGEAFAARPADPLDYPLDELLIMHRLTQERAIELHGSGIVRADGLGNLFVGHSGAGKSTTTRLWAEREEIEVLSDDRIIVRKDAPSTGRMRMYGTPWHGEAMYASPASAPLARILILQHGHGNVLTRLSASEAVAELFARSFVPFHRHEYVDSALDFLEELVDAVPVYRYDFEPDQRAVDTIVNLHD